MASLQVSNVLSRRCTLAVSEVSQSPLRAGSSANSSLPSRLHLASCRISGKDLGNCPTIGRAERGNNYNRTKLRLSTVRSKVDADVTQADSVGQAGERTGVDSEDSSKAAIQKEISKAVRKTATTFAPRASTKSKNPAVPGSLLYSVFEVQAYVCMALGGLLSFNLVFPSDEPDLWRLMGMWSVWMFTVPSLRARDCSPKEKEALNYLFILVPLINVGLPLVWRSFAAVWSADVLAFCAMYAWKMEWFGSKVEESES